MPPLTSTTTTTVTNTGIIPVSLLKEINDAREAIDKKHQSLGGDNGFLGKPLDKIKNAPDSIGVFRRYQGGMIYWTRSTNAHEVHGAILDKWSRLGFERSILGYPVQDELGVPDGVGRFSQFQRGMIYWTPSTGAHEIHGAILDKWAALGFERGFLGYPVTDETDLGVHNGRFSNFQNGQIAWSPASGAAVSAARKVPKTSGGLKPLGGLNPDGSPSVRRVVVASGHMDITDDETFGSNEHGTADGQDQGFVSFGQPSTALKLIGKAGGEVRVELEVTASATIEGDVQISGAAKLFEGTSEETHELNGTTDINFTVPRDNFIQRNFTVRNTDEGGDFADIRLTVSNHAA